MNHLKGGLFLFVVGALLMVGWRFAAPFFEEREQRLTSDAVRTKGTVTIAVDDWIGHFPLCSSEMKKRMRGDGYLLKCANDQTDFTQRLQGIEEGDIDFTVAAVDAYVLKGAPLDFPGTIVAVIDESKGRDAVVARKDFAGSINDLKGKTGFTVAFMPNSPSEHLLKAIGVHFDIPMLRQSAGAWRVEATGYPDALKKLLSGDVDVAALREPEVSQAIAEGGFVKLLGTEDIDKLIVNTLLVNRRFSQDKPKVVKILLANYFRVLKYYRDDPDLLVKDIEKTVNHADGRVAEIVKGISWVGLQENAIRWFGVNTPGSRAREGLVETIEATEQVLIESGDFPSAVIPDDDPYRLIYSAPVKTLFEQMKSGQFAGTGSASVPQAGVPIPGEKRFRRLSDAAWDQLREVGTLKVRPIAFQSGTARLTDEGKQQITKAVAHLERYPNFRVRIKGHTGLRGDPAANRKLSQERAATVVQHLATTYGVDPNRLQPVGAGSSEPLPRKPKESQRTYNYRLPRVELHLMAEIF